VGVVDGATAVLQGCGTGHVNGEARGKENKYCMGQRGTAWDRGVHMALAAGTPVLVWPELVCMHAKEAARWKGSLLCVFTHAGTTFTCGNYQRATV
jgi:hypothetical protein